MKSYRILMVLALVVVAFSSAMAGDVYIKRNQTDSENSRPSVYIKKDSRSKYGAGVQDALNNRGSGARAAYGIRADKIALAQDAKDVGKRIEIFNAWRASDREPKTTEESISYMISKSAVHEAVLMERRKALILDIEQDRKRALRNEAAGVSAVTHTDENQTQDGLSPLAPNVRRDMILPRPRVFVDPNASQKQKGRVYNNSF